MNLNERALVELLKYGLGYSDECFIPHKVDWQWVQETSYQHCVEAIVFDGIQRCYDENVSLLDSDRTLDWYGQVTKQEDIYHQHKTAITELASFFHQYNIRMMVLKGYGLSLYYPVPCHRSCCDIDIFLFGDRKRADRLLSEKLGVSIDTSLHRHTVFKYRGLSVENHFDFLNRYAHLSNRKINRRLKDMLSQSICTKINDGVDIWLPSPDFNALFVLRHMAAHFAGSALKIRQVLDWGLFVEKCHDEVDWRSLSSFVEELNMHHFLGAVNYICYCKLGFNKSLFTFYEDESFGECVFRDLLDMENMRPKEKGYMKFVYSRCQKWWGNRWKHRIVYNEGLFVTFIVQVFAHLMKPASLHNN